MGGPLIHVDEESSPWLCLELFLLLLYCPGCFQKLFFLYTGLIISIIRILELEGMNEQLHTTVWMSFPNSMLSKEATNLCDSI